MSESHDHKDAHAGHADIDNHVGGLHHVFVSLMVLTVFTVAAYFLHLPHRAGDHAGARWSRPSRARWWRATSCTWSPSAS